MTAPNLKTPTTITGKTVPYTCTATLASVLANGASSNKVLKVNTVRASNKDGTASYDVNLTLYRSSAHTYIAYIVPVPAGSSVTLVNRDEWVYLEEGDALYASASSASKIDLTISYEDIS